MAMALSPTRFTLRVFASVIPDRPVLMRQSGFEIEQVGATLSPARPMNNL